MPPPDTSMCVDARCPSRVRCDRHPDSGRLPNLERQSWCTFGRREGESACPDFVMKGGR